MLIWPRRWLCPQLTRDSVSCFKHLRNAYRSISTFQGGDNVILRRTDKPEAAGFLVQKLQKDGRLESHKGALAHRDIIGKKPRDLVKSTAGHVLRLHHPTLAEWVRLTPRLVTPVYPGEANLIVSLLDINVDPLLYKAGTDRFEILEAGTGHGSLTLHLARAIHAGNTNHSTRVQPETSVDHFDKRVAKGRAAVIHTVDTSTKNSNHAKNTISSFRRGIYAPDVDFHVGNISEFLAKERKKRGTEQPFLDRVVLDLPSAHNEIDTVHLAIKTDGILAVYCPQITQIIDSLRAVHRRRLPLYLDQVVELGANTSAGKQWDVRLVKIRKPHLENGHQKPPLWNQSDRQDDESNSLSRTPMDPVNNASNDSSTAVTQDNTKPVVEDHDYEVVCRPKYGELITAGGFLALWRRKSHQIKLD